MKRIQLYIDFTNYFYFVEPHGHTFDETYELPSFILLDVSNTCTKHKLEKNTKKELKIKRELLAC